MQHAGIGEVLTVDLTRNISLGRVFGVEIGVHASWVIIALLIAWSWWQRFVVVYGRPVGAAVVMAVITTACFFASVLIHELAHALEGEGRGMTIEGITLFVFGGATRTEFDVKRPRDEFIIAAVGPFTSLVMAAVFGLIATYAGAAGLDAIAQITGPLAWVNLALAVFNLLPGAPLDGGRVLRSGIWAMTGDRDRAVTWAARAGQVVGGLLIGLGLLQLFFVPGAAFGGLWLAIIGWFLMQSALVELVQHNVKGLLGDRTIGDLAKGLPEPLPDSASVAEAEDRLVSSPWDFQPVSIGGQVRAVVTAADLSAVPRPERAQRQVRELIHDRGDMPTVPADTPAADALGEMRQGQPVFVTDTDGTITGVLTTERVASAVQRLQQLSGDRA